MITLLIMVLLTLLSIAALSTGVVLIIASFSEWFVAWLITRVTGDFLITVTAGFTLIIIGLYIKKGQHWFTSFRLRHEISKEITEYLKNDIETTMEAHIKRLKETRKEFVIREPESDIILKVKKALDESDEFIKKCKEDLMKGETK